MIMLTATGPGLYTHTFAGYVPSPRAGGDPWRTIVVEEAATAAGPWTEYASGEIAPLDPDPAEPLSRAINAPGATMPAGWQRVTFVDDLGYRQPFRPVYSGQSWAPTVQDVADMCGAYANTALDYDTDATVVRVFDETTTPSRATVEGYIHAAVQDIAGWAGVTAERLEQLATLANRAAAAHAAAAVEAERAKTNAADNANSVWRWHQNNYLGLRGELIKQARAGALRLT